MDANKITDLLKDEGFAAAVFSAENSEAVQKLFADKGVDISVAEIEALGKLLSGSEPDEGELDEDDLEQVAGGVGVATFDLEELKSLSEKIKSIIFIQPSQPPETSLKAMITKFKSSPITNPNFKEEEPKKW